MTPSADVTRGLQLFATESRLALESAVPASRIKHDLRGLPYTKEELTGLAESFLRDFPVGEFPYLMEHVRQHVTDRPQGKATTSSGST